jgi:predicted RNase H-like nuclease (RuvC/YqgF family)
VDAIGNAQGLVNQRNCPKQWVGFAIELETELQEATFEIERLRKSNLQLREGDEDAKKLIQEMNQRVKNCSDQILMLSQHTERLRIYSDTADLYRKKNERLTKKVKQLYKRTEEQKDRIIQLEEDLMEAKNKHAALVADVALYEDRGERIKRLEKAANDTIKLAAKHIKQLVDGGDEAIYKTNLFDREECWNKAKEAKL